MSPLARPLVDSQRQIPQCFSQGPSWTEPQLPTMMTDFLSLTPSHPVLAPERCPLKPSASLPWCQALLSWEHMLRRHTVPEGGSPSWGVRHFDEGEEKGAWTTAAAGPHLPQGHSHVSVSGGFETGTDVFLDVLMDTRYLRNGGPVGTRICGPGH